MEQHLAGLIKPLFPVEALRASWQGIEQQVGAFQELGKNVCLRADTTGSGAGGHLRLLSGYVYDVNITLNDAGEIIGLTITPVGTVEQQANATYQGLPVVRAPPERFQE